MLATVAHSRTSTATAADGHTTLTIAVQAATAVDRTAPPLAIMSDRAAMVALLRVPVTLDRVRDRDAPTATVAVIATASIVVTTEARPVDLGRTRATIRCTRQRHVVISSRALTDALRMERSQAATVAIRRAPMVAVVISAAIRTAEQAIGI